MPHLRPRVPKRPKTELPHENEPPRNARVRAQPSSPREILVHRLLTEFLCPESPEDARDDAFRSGDLLRAGPNDLRVGERREDVRLRSLPGQFPVPYAPRAAQEDARGGPGEAVLLSQVSDAFRDAESVQSPRKDSQASFRGKR